MAGVAVNDRELGARVRRLTLKQIEKILLGDDEDYKKQIILKLSSCILPRMSEISGGGGEPLTIKIVNYGNTDSSSLHPETIPTILLEGNGQ